MYNVRGLSELAHELAGSGQYEKALELVNREIKTDPNNANAWYNKGIHSPQLKELNHIFTSCGITAL